MCSLNKNFGMKFLTFKSQMKLPISIIDIALKKRLKECLDRFKDL
jgi:hypothetical protein